MSDDNTSPSSTVTAVDQAGAPAKSKILLVDDEQNVLNALKRSLRNEPFEVFTTTDGREAIAIARREQPHIVVCDMRMPGLTGVEVLQAIGEVAPQCARVMLSGYSDMASTIDAINLGHLHRYLSKPWNEEELKVVLNELVELGRLRREREDLAQKLSEKIHELELLNADLDKRVESRTQEILQTNLFLDQAHRELKLQFLSAVKVFSNLLELRSPHMGGHSRRVAELAKLIGKEMNLADYELNDLYVAALLHDIGKIGLSDHALFTPIAELDGDSRAALMKHPAKGQTALMGLSELQAASRIIRHHHERFDGQGFPDGLLKATIPVASRILAVAEDYDELQQGWLAAKKLTEAEALEFVMGASGKRYDPDVLAHLPAALEKLRAAPREEEKLLEVSDLKPGMVVMRDLISPEGLLLVAKDGVVTPHLIDHLKEAIHKDHKIRVYVHKTKTGPYRRPGQ